MTIATVRQTDQQSRAAKFYYKPDSKQVLKTRICIRPVNTFWMKDIPEHYCLCTVVLHAQRGIGQTRFWRELKYVHKCCPHHGGGRIECEYDLAG